MQGMGLWKKLSTAVWRFALVGTMVSVGIGYSVSRGGVLRAAPARAASDWIIESSLGGGVSVNDATFLDEQDGWVVGNGGSMFVTHDGGLDWAKYISGSGDDLLHIHFLNAQIGYAVGGNTLLHTTDGGEEWLQVRSQTLPTDMQDIRAVDANTLWVATSPKDGTGTGNIYRSTDGGQSWASVYAATYWGFGSLTLATTTDIWAAGLAGLYHSADNGNSWSAVGVDSNNGRADVVLFSGQLGFVAGVAQAPGSSIFIARTIDGGSTWAETKIDGAFSDPVVIRSIHGLGRSLLLAFPWHSTYYGRTSFVYASNDLGAHWAAQSLPSGTDMVMAASYRGTTPWALTQNGTFLHFGALPPPATPTPTPVLSPTQTPIPSPTPTTAAVVPFGSPPASPTDIPAATPTDTPPGSPHVHGLQVRSLSPKVVVAGSDTSVTIQGNGFDAGATVSVGDTDITDAQLTNAGLRFNVPPHVVPGVYDVQVQLDSGDVGVLHKSLTVVPKLTIIIAGNNRTVIPSHTITFDVRSLPGATLSAAPQSAGGRPVPHIMATIAQTGSGHWRVMLAVGIHVPAGRYRLALSVSTGHQRATAMPTFTVR